MFLAATQVAPHLPVVGEQEIVAVEQRVLPTRVVVQVVEQTQQILQQVVLESWLSVMKVPAQKPLEEQSPLST